MPYGKIGYGFTTEEAATPGAITTPDVPVYKVTLPLTPLTDPASYAEPAIYVATKLGAVSDPNSTDPFESTTPSVASNVTVFRSTDPDSPVLSGLSGSLAKLLEKCLVSGYPGKAAPGGWSVAAKRASRVLLKVSINSVDHYLHVNDDQYAFSHHYANRFNSTIGSDLPPPELGLTGYNEGFLLASRSKFGSTSLQPRLQYKGSWTPPGFYGGFTIIGLPEGIIGKSDFTVESQVYLLSNLSTITLLDTRTDLQFNRTDTSSAVTITISSSAILFTYDTDLSLSVVVAIPITTWTHVAVVRLNDVISMYVNGVRVLSSPFTLSITSVSNYISIGAIAALYSSNPDSDGTVLDGSSICEFALSWVAHYDDDFTPPTEGFPSDLASPPSSPTSSLTSVLSVGLDPSFYKFKLPVCPSLTIKKASGSTGQSNQWMIVASSSTFYLFVKSDPQSSEWTTSCMFGAYRSYSDLDLNSMIVGDQTAGTLGYVTQQTGSSSPGHFITRSYDSSATTSYASPLTRSNIPQSSSAAHVSGSVGLPYSPSIPLVLSRKYLSEYQSSGSHIARGYMLGLWLPMHNRPLNSGQIIQYGGRTLEVVTIGLSGQVFIEISNTWS